MNFWYTYNLILNVIPALIFNMLTKYIVFMISLFTYIHTLLRINDQIEDKRKVSHIKASENYVLMVLKNMCLKMTS